MADLMTNFFGRTKMIQLNHLDLEPQACIHVRACLGTDVCTSCTLLVCILCTLPSNCRYFVRAIRNPTIPHALIFLKKTHHWALSDFEEFDVFVYSGGWVYAAAFSLP